MAVSVSRKLHESINRFFLINMVQDDYFENERVLYDGNINKFLFIKDLPICEIPTCCLGIIAEKLDNNAVYVPLHDLRLSRKAYKTAHMVFNNLVGPPCRSGTLYRVRTSSGEVYYGSYGLILDANKNPLLLSAVNTASVGARKYIQELLLYVNPSVYTGDGMIDKFIRDKVIPYILSHGVSFAIGFGGTKLRNTLSYKIINREEKVIPKVIISDSINNFFESPVEKDTSKANEHILLNIDSFMAHMQQ